MVTSDGYTLCQKKNQIIIDLPQTWKTLDCSAFPIVDRQPYLSTEQEMCLLAIVKELFATDVKEESADTEKSK